MTPYQYKPLKRNKYGNTKVEYRGRTFDSILERDRFIFLEAEQAARRVTGLQAQVRFHLSAYGKPICDYIADFTYRLADGTRVTEDAKGVQTDVFKLKRKLYEAMTDQPIHIVTKHNLTSLPCP